MKLATAPIVLMVQLKRFSFADDKSIKLDVPVDCPLTGLDLTELVHQKVNAVTRLVPLHAEPAVHLQNSK